MSLAVENTIPVVEPLAEAGADDALFVQLMEKFQAFQEEAAVEHFAAGGVYVKILRMNKGWAARQHTHHYDHLTVVAHGSVAVRVDGNVAYYDAPTAVVVKADKQHDFIAMEDGTICLCVHKVRDEETIDEFVKIPWKES